MRHSSKLKQIHLLVLIAILMVISGSALARDLSDQPGYIDLDFIQIPDDADEIQDIDLGPVLKDVIREAKNNDDMAMAELLSMVRHLRMRAFSVDSSSESDAKRAVEKVSKRLKNDDWDNLMKFKDGGALTTISTKYHNDNMVGLMVVVYSPGEEVMFINVMGDLDLGKLMKLAGEFDGDELEEYLEKVESRTTIHTE